LSKALACYVANPNYLERCSREGAVRFDLDGLPAGKVTEREANYAKLRRWMMMVHR
jgi:sRNA-binding protein